MSQHQRSHLAAPIERIAPHRRLLAAIGLGGKPARAFAQVDPTETPEPQRVAAPPSPTPGTNVIAAPPTATQPPSVPPTATQPSLAQPSIATSTPVPPPTELPPERQPVATEPPATEPVLAQPETAVEDTCPPYNPFGWLCWPGPDGPWFPVFPSPELTAATGIAWYGVRADDPFAGDDVATGWHLESVAWTVAGEEVSRCTVDVDTDGHRWLLADGQARLAGTFAVGRDAAGQPELAGAINDQPYTLALGGRAQEAGTAPAVSLEPAQEALVMQWLPLMHDVGGLLDIAASGEGGELQGEGRCAVAGFLAGINCLAGLTVPIAGYGICYDAIDTAADWCYS